MNTFVIADPNKCIGCRTCEVACVVAHAGKNFFELDSSQIEFHPRLSVIKTEDASGPVQCRHCESAACMEVCPNNCISRIDGVIYIDRSTCIGCKTCNIACPVGAVDRVVEVNVDEKLAQQSLKDDESKLYFKERMVGNKCDLCKDKKDGPACAKVCPTKAFKIIQTDEDIVKFL
jgi:Fe-S-cluster-containing hydrogenase components 2